MSKQKQSKKIIIEISARHAHLSREHINILFGKGYRLHKLKKLSQNGEFAANEVIDLKTAKNVLKNVRVLGPSRDYTQVEISKTGAFFLGLNPLVRASGDLEDTPGVTIVGPKGEVDLPHGVILSYRHIHCSLAQSRKYGLKDKQLVKVKINGTRGLVFDNVMIKIKKDFDFRMHIDTDEANSAGVDNGNNLGEVIIK